MGETEEITRKRRDGLSTDLEQPPGIQSRLSNVFVPDEEEEEKVEELEEREEEYEYEEYEDDLFLSRDGSEIELENLDEEERMKRRAERRAQRQAKRRAKAAEKRMEESKKKPGKKEKTEETE